MSEPTPIAAPAPAPEPTPPAPAPSAVSWLPADADPMLMGHAQNAGWQNPADAVKSHFELQKLFGADRHGRTLVVPKEDASAEEVAAFHTKLGRPSVAGDYKLPVPEGDDGKFAGAASEQFHAAGLSVSQGQKLAAWWNETQTAAVAAQAAQQEAALAAEHQELAKDWGTGPEAGMRRELARRAAEQMGLDAQAIDGLEKVSGFSKTMKALAKIGDMLRESGGEGMTELGSFGSTPEGAKAKRAQLMADESFRRAAMNPASKEWAELQKLDRIIAGA